jgi:hypothetical protein
MLLEFADYVDDFFCFASEWLDGVFTELFFLDLFFVCLFRKALSHR